MKTKSSAILIAVAFGLLAFLQKMQAVVPPPDGGYPNFNTAEGQNALFSLTGGSANTSVGWFSLWGNTDGSFNSGLGAGALLFNTNGNGNTALGAATLLFNTTGFNNTAVGTSALLNNTTGSDNTAVGTGALLNNNESGSNANTAIGSMAGSLISGSGNVCIGAGVSGEPGVSSTTWIRNVYDSFANARAVYVDSDNKIGTLSSSCRYKEEIKPMDKSSETLFALKPVTFRYKKAVDPSQALSFGLIAEEVAEVHPALITRDEQGKPQTVRYELVNAMLLNEFLKEHRKVEEQQLAIVELKSVVAQQQKEFCAAIAEQQKEMENVITRLKQQEAKIQKVNDRIELTKPASQVVANNE